MLGIGFFGGVWHGTDFGSMLDFAGLDNSTIIASCSADQRPDDLRKRPDDFVFPAPDGRGRDQRSTARAVERTLKRAKLDGQGISSHNFRHTFASLLIVGLKFDPVGVAAQLGHSNPSTTLRFYAHLFDKAKFADEAREELSEGFGHLLAASS